MAHTLQEQENEYWTSNKKRKRGEEEDREQTETEETFRKFGTTFHQKFHWVKVVKMITRTGNALFVLKNDRSRKLMTEMKGFNGKECSFRPIDTISMKTYILMGVPICTTEELILQDDVVLEATRMTKWNNKTKLENHTEIVKVVLTGKEQSARFTKGYGSFHMRPFVKGPQQCFNCQKFVYHARTCRSEIVICRYCTGRHHSHQCKDNT